MQSGELSLADSKTRRFIVPSMIIARFVGTALEEELKGLCSVEKAISDINIVNTAGMEAKLLEDATSAMGRPAKQMLKSDFCGESKG